MNFEFATAARLVFGPGSIGNIGALLAPLGRRALVTTGKRSEHAAPLLKAMAGQNLEAVTFTVAGEPTIELVQQGVQAARKAGCDLVIGFGGGSSLDAAKAIAAMLTNPGDLLDYLEVIGNGRPLPLAPAPFVAVPTTAGTGAEVTRNAVLTSRQHQVKVSLRSPMLLARLVVIDPELTYTMPAAVTASTGMDALTQLIEPFVSNAANPITDAFCREGMSRIARSLGTAYANGTDTAAREDMAIASLLGGLALANAKLGGVHGLAGVLGGMFHAPHGAICAALLPHVMAANVQALGCPQPDSQFLHRYREVARILTGSPAATAADGVAWVRSLCRQLNIPGLSGFGLAAENFPAVIAQAALASSMKGNPVKLTPEDMAAILKNVL
jgi:alcohol dehydrogenase class IV